MRTAVIGHVEWVHFLRVGCLPTPGEIVHATDSWEEPAGGGAGAAVQLLKLSGDTTFFTALGDDELGRRSEASLSDHGLHVAAARRAGPTRRGVTHVDSDGERTITVLGERIHPKGDDPLPWERLAETDGAYVTAADVPALRYARRAGIVVATARILPLLKEAGVQLDALVGSAVDPDEQYTPGDLDPAPHLVVRTMGSKGGTVVVAGEKPQHFPAPPLPGPISDRYGAGDSFAAGLTFALAEGRDPLDAAGFAARCGAAVLTGRGPYEGQLSRDDLE
ncbi:MAG: PfkB family carbohydrate kinase [Actinomycetota bacterium]